ncbi:MAG: hypothetical protein AB1640_06825 [bacterium]
MEARTRAVWDFMQRSYRKGALDELLGLAGALADPGADLGEQLGNFEDRLSAADFARFETMSGEALTPVLQALAREDVLESLRVLTATLRAVVEGVKERTGGDAEVMRETLALARRNLSSLGTVAVALAPILAKVYGPAVEAFIREKGGALAAGAVNAGCAAVNRKPEIVARVISDLFARVDGRAFGEAAERVLGAVLDQKPPLVGWTTAALVKRTRRRLFG